MGESPVQSTPDGHGCLFWVRVVPGAASASIVGWQADGKLRVRVAVPPERGKANKALVEMLAKSLGLRNSAVSVISGKSSREKRVRADGVLPARIIGLGPEGN